MRSARSCDEHDDERNLSPAASEVERMCASGEAPETATATLATALAGEGSTGLAPELGLPPEEEPVAAAAPEPPPPPSGHLCEGQGKKFISNPERKRKEAALQRGPKPAAT